MYKPSKCTWFYQILSTYFWFESIAKDKAEYNYDEVILPMDDFTMHWIDNLFWMLISFNFYLLEI